MYVAFSEQFTSEKQRAVIMFKQKQSTDFSPYGNIHRGLEQGPV